MREIKFRMWSKKYKKMFGEKELAVMYTAGVKAIKQVIPSVEESEVPIPLTGISLPFQDDAILMQYTGLKDKNSKEIYEGDTVYVVYDGNLYRYQIVFDEQELDFKATNGKEKYGNNFQYLLCCDEVEVIGNIYENPELMEGQKHE